jgi:ribonuclease-3
LWSFLKRIFPSSTSETTPLDLRRVQDILGYSFKNIELLQLGLTHRSYHRVSQNSGGSNERLEFLGDSVLGLVVAAQVYADDPDKSEGELTKLKAMLVNELTLSMVGRISGLNNHILLSTEEERTGGRERASISADAMESVIGAIYLDGGFEAARDVVLRLIYAHRDRIMTDESQRNYKGELLELAQGKGVGVPRYDVVSELGPDHEKVFHVVVIVAGNCVGEGKGLSKKEAEQRAASVALEHFKKNSI